MIFNYCYFLVYDRQSSDPLYLVRIMSYSHSSICWFFVFCQLDGQTEAVIRNFSGESTTSFGNLSLVVVWEIYYNSMWIQVKQLLFHFSVNWKMFELQQQWLKSSSNFNPRYFETPLFIYCFAFDSPTGWFIYIE